MNLLHIVILSVVEGITEFLPVSSTYHLLVASKLLGVPQTDFWKLFEVFIQSGAILSVLILSWRELVKDRQLMLKVMASFIPTAVVGLVLYKLIKTMFFQVSLLTSIVFVVVGVAFIITERLVADKQLLLKKDLTSLTIPQAVIIGLVQALAVVPGVSRAGSVILGMIFLQFKRDDSARYSFYLSIPTIFAASALDLFKMRGLLVAHTDYFSYLILGFMVTFAASFIVVRWLLTYLKTHSLTNFGLYRIGLFIVLLLLTITHIAPLL